MTEETTQRPQPDPALRQLDFLVGTWSMRGHLVGSEEENIVGEATFDWLPGGFFLRQLVELDFAGMFKVESEELIGYDPRPASSPPTSSRTSRLSRCRTNTTSTMAR